MPLSDIVNVSISIAGANPTQAGFGKPLILGLKATSTIFGSDVYREYSSIAGLIADGFVTTDPEYLAAAAVLAASPRPPLVAIGKRTNLPTITFDLKPVAINSHLYEVEINGQLASYTSDGTATVIEITAGLKTAIDALAIAGLTTTDNGGTTGKLHLAMGTAGAFLRVANPFPAALGCYQQNVDPGILADLDAIRVVDSTWYGVISCSASDAELMALAAGIESRGLLLVQQTQNSDCVTTSPSTDAGNAGNGSPMARAKTATLLRTAFIYGGDNGSMSGAAWIGKNFPSNPGSENWDFCALAGVPVDLLTDTQIENVRGKNGTVYTTLTGLNLTQSGSGGNIAGGEWIDVIRGRDWLVARISTRILVLQANASAAGKKIPFTDKGIATIEAEVRAQMQEGITAGVLADDPKPTVSAPLAADVSSGDKASRTLPSVTFAATLAGAINAVTIAGTLTE